MDNLIEKYKYAFPSSHGKVWAEIECGKGWEKLIEPVLVYLHDHNQNKAVDEKITIAQIKEKFGKLRIYIDGRDEEVDQLISYAEHQSGTTCETCGAEGKVRVKNNWVNVACDTHAIK